jgi:hypothetical protein
MKARVLSVFVFVAGLTLLLVVAFGTKGSEVSAATLPSASALPASNARDLARAVRNPAGSELASANETIPNAALTVPMSNLPHIHHSGTITFTPAFTVYLPATFNYYSTIPILISPANGSNLNTLVPLLRWNMGSIPNAIQAWVEVSENPQFSPVNDWIYTDPQGAGERQLEWNLAPSTRYYWRACVVYNGTERYYSDVWTLVTGSNGVILPAPTLIAPLNGTTTSSTQVTFQWSAVEGRTDYLVWITDGRQQIQVTETGDNIAVKMPRSVTSPTGGGYVIITKDTQVTEILWPGGTIRWWVEARNDYAIGAPSAWAEFNTP